MPPEPGIPPDFASGNAIQAHFRLTPRPNNPFCNGWLDFF
jgi:hypothetical protein